jgi:outer membrane lipoprotein SlyB
MNCFAIGAQDAMTKTSSYLSESARAERKIERHGKRGYASEKKRLSRKGAAQGTVTGGVTGGLGGAYVGGALGKGKGALIGGALGAAGGAALGRIMGRSAGKREAREREDASQYVKGKGKKAKEKFFRGVTKEKQRAREVGAQEMMGRAAMMRARDSRSDRRRRY